MEHFTCCLYGGILQAALYTFSISIRHLLPMNELERAIFSGSAAGAAARFGCASAVAPITEPAITRTAVRRSPHRNLLTKYLPSPSVELGAISARLNDEHRFRDRSHP